MYKVPSKNNKVIFRLQDFTKNDNVDENMFEEGQNSKGEMRLQCQVKVMHLEEFEALQQEPAIMKQHVEEANNNLMQKNIEIKKLKSEVAKHKRANIDENTQLIADKFNIQQEHINETRALEKQHQDELKTINETHTNQLLDIDETHRKHVEKISAQYISKLDDADDKLLKEVKANKQASDNLRDEMLTMKETHKDEAIALQKQHHNEIKKLQHAHSSELQAQQKQHDYDITQLKEANTTMKQEHLIEINQIEQKHRDEIKQIRGSFLGLLANEHAKDLSDFNDCGDLPFYIKPFAKRFLTSFDEFKKRKYMNTPQKIVETYELEGEKE